MIDSPQQLIAGETQESRIVDRAGLIGPLPLVAVAFAQARANSRRANPLRGVAIGRDDRLFGRIRRSAGRRGSARPTWSSPRGSAATLSLVPSEPASRPFVANSFDLVDQHLTCASVSVPPLAEQTPASACPVGPGRSLAPDHLSGTIARNSGSLSGGAGPSSPLAPWQPAQFCWYSAPKSKTLSAAPADRPGSACRGSCSRLPAEQS